MKQKTHLSNKSIRSRTLIYFMVMALSMITLLWTVQEWFFSTQYSNFKQREILNIMDGLGDGFSWPAAPEYFDDIHRLTIDNSLVVYFFSFKKLSDDGAAYEKYELDGKTYNKLKGQFGSEAVFSAVTAKENIFVDSGSNTLDLSWSAVQQDRFIDLMGINAISNSPITDNYVFDKSSRRLCYASLAGIDNSTETKVYFYFYAEATVNSTDVTVDIIRFEFILLTVLCILLALIFSILLSSMLSSPITKISKRAESFAKGNYSVDFGQSDIREINNLATTLNFAATEFNKTEQMRRDFIANISHDLRTPLTMVKAYAEMIRDISGSNEQKRNQHAQVIIDEANRLSLLVEDIQKLSKIQAGTDTVNISSFDLDELCSGVLRQFSLLYEELGHTLSYHSGGSVSVSADRDKISQVLYNLIGNAINYANKEDKQINVRVIIKDKSAVVEVEDNGKGIAEEDLDAVWDRYYRANQVKRAVVGSGLGLSIVKNILVAHKTEYGVKSELNKGTTFWFALPKG